VKATTRKPRRVTWDQLEQLAFVNPGVFIERDDELGIGVLTLLNPRREYVANLPAVTS
jgi:hypothetical protein